MPSSASAAAQGAGPAAATSTSAAAATAAAAAAATCRCAFGGGGVGGGEEGGGGGWRTERCSRSGAAARFGEGFFVLFFKAGLFSYLVCEGRGEEIATFTSSIS